MDPATLAAFNASRSFANKAVPSLCYAPHTSLYLDTRGFVRVCCHNSTYVLGHAQKDSMDDMWRGARIGVLRDALNAMEFGPGCDFCRKQTADGWLANAAMRRYDQFAVPDAVPEWPQQIEFSISNSCNLECIMCTGRWSSAIRAHREKLPPIPSQYPDGFILSLRKYLPHLKRAKFLGGEPFLIREYYSLWDMMLEDGLEIPCHVTTNGTQYNAKIERVLQKIPMSFSISLDGVTKKTVESIRVNADYDAQMRHLALFRAYTKERKTNLSLTFCFMRPNWHEFADYCLFADSWDCQVGVNTVVNPPQFAIYNLPLAELRPILDQMEIQAQTTALSLKRNKAVWFAELDRVHRRCRALESEQLVAV
jgi:MoaA/NifB/PqqE/SkfB family radical SAM enzyme